MTKFEIYKDKVDLLVKTEVIPTIDKVADDIVSDAQSYAPVDTGKLKDSIKKEIKEDGTWKIVADTAYAWMVEMGTRNNPAQPYLRPALYGNMSKFKK